MRTGSSTAGTVTVPTPSAVGRTTVSSATAGSAAARVLSSPTAPSGLQKAMVPERAGSPGRKTAHARASRAASVTSGGVVGSSGVGSVGSVGGLCTKTNLLLKFDYRVEWSRVQHLRTVRLRDA